MDHGVDGNDSAIWSAPTEQTPRRPTRPPKDPLLQVTKLNASTLEHFQDALRGYLQNPPAEPEHSQCEIEVWGDATVLVPVGNGDTGQVEPDKRPMSIAEALIPQNNARETMKRQRGVAKAFIDAIQRVDGFRYAFHNNWKSGEDYRFSYYCNDSLLNKDRVANGKHGSAGKRAYKPVYDCKGVMSVKFHTARQCVDIIYKHIPLHETYEVRAPPPRKDAKRRRSWEMNHPERVRVARFLDQSQAGVPGSTEDSIHQPALGRPKEKRRKSHQPQPQPQPHLKAPSSAEHDLREESMRSLLELIRTTEKKPPETPEQPSPTVGANGAQVNHPHPVTTNGTTSATTGPPKDKSIARQRNACAICRFKRQKCDGLRPCSACRSKTWPCFYLDVDSTDNQLLPQMEVDANPSPQSQNTIAAPMNMISANTDVATASAELESQLFETKTELALIKEKLAEAEGRVKQLEAEKTSAPRPAPAARRTPQVSGVRAHSSHEDRPQNAPTYNNNKNNMTFNGNQQFSGANAPTQTPTQNPYGATPAQPAPQQPAYTNPQTQAQTIAPTYGPQQPQRQTYASTAAQPTYVQTASSAARQNPNMYGQPMAWPQSSYPYGAMQTPPQNTYGGRMR